jgi:hypothetical protein
MLPASFWPILVIILFVVFHLMWNPPKQRTAAAAATASELPGNELVRMQNITISW